MKTKILSLRPTQFAVGMDEVAHRRNDMLKMTRHQLHKYLREHPVPVIRGPDGLYLIDRHHLATALWEMGHTHIQVTVKADLRKKRNFWNEMIKNNWVYLKDQFGEYRSPEELPTSVRGLADNRWRSLAWKVRIKGGFDKSPEPFSEFLWAEFFRRCRKYLDINDVKQALMLCQSPMAKRLPGYKYGTKTNTRG